MRFVISLLILFPILAQADWQVDFSRRQKDLRRIEMERRAAQDTPIIQQVFEKDVPKEKLVILNTEAGFVPDTVKLKQGQAYEISVVNVNKKQKNVSFMFDAFAEHHGTFFGEVVQFVIHPKKEGLYPFFSPESEFKGKVLVYAEDKPLEPVPPIKIRQPASSKKKMEYHWVRGGNG